MIACRMVGRPTKGFGFGVQVVLCCCVVRPVHILGNIPQVVRGCVKVQHNAKQASRAQQLKRSWRFEETLSHVPPCRVGH